MKQWEAGLKQSFKEGDGIQPPFPPRCPRPLYIWPIETNAAI